MPRGPGFRQVAQRPECPWRADIAPGKFPPERFDQLRNTWGQGFRPLFACHMSPQEDPSACVGYLLAEGMQNWAVRLAALRGDLDPGALRALGPLYGTFDEMAVANGCASREPDDDTCDYLVPPSGRCRRG